MHYNVNTNILCDTALQRTTYIYVHGDISFKWFNIYQFNQVIQLVYTCNLVYFFSKTHEGQFKFRNFIIKVLYNSVSDVTGDASTANLQKAKKLYSIWCKRLVLGNNNTPFWMQSPVVRQNNFLSSLICKEITELSNKLPVY